MPTLAKERRAYDHRLRRHVSQNGVLAAGCGPLQIPRSTVASWKIRRSRAFVSLDVFGQNRQELLNRIVKLERKARTLAAVVRFLLALVRLSGLRLAGQRLPEGVAKARVLVRSPAPCRRCR